LFEDNTEVVRFHSQPEQLRSVTTAGALRALREEVSDFRRRNERRNASAHRQEFDGGRWNVLG